MTFSAAQYMLCSLGRDLLVGCDAMQYSVAAGYQRFGGSCCLHLQGEVVGDGKKGQACIFVIMLVNFSKPASSMQTSCKS